MFRSVLFSPRAVHWAQGPSGQLLNCVCSVHICLAVLGPSYLLFSLTQPTEAYFSLNKSPEEICCSDCDVGVAGGRLCCCVVFMFLSTSEEY